MEGGAGDPVAGEATPEVRLTVVEGEGRVYVGAVAGFCGMRTKLVDVTEALELALPSMSASYADAEPEVVNDPSEL